MKAAMHARKKTYPTVATVVTTLPPSVSKAIAAMGAKLGGEKKKV
jgi:hypothetical protein